MDNPLKRKKQASDRDVDRYGRMFSWIRSTSFDEQVSEEPVDEDDDD